MKISEGKLVTFNHRILDNQNAEISLHRRVVLFKPDSMHTKLFKALFDKQANDKFQVPFSVDELGKYDRNKVIAIPKSQLAGANTFKPGMMFRANNDGIAVLGKLISEDENSIHLDTNPPLIILGQDVTFEIEVLDVCTPSDEIQAQEKYHTSDLVLSPNNHVPIFN